MYLTVIAAALANSSVRTLSQQEELPLLRDHLLRLDRNSRHDRFHGFMDDSFIERYAEKCANDGTVIIAYLRRRRGARCGGTASAGSIAGFARPRSPSASNRQCGGRASAASCSAS